MSTISGGKFLFDDVSYGYAFEGCVLSNVTSFISDAERYAVEIQNLRDSKGYALSDEKVDFVKKVGCTVILKKNSTHVFEGPIEDRVDKSVPDFFPAYEWVNLDEIGDRKVIDKCYNYMSDTLHSVLVIPEGDHPNIVEAKEKNLPIALWSESGQVNLIKSKSTDWFNQQITKVNKTIVSNFIQKVIDETIDAYLKPTA